MLVCALLQAWTSAAWTPGCTPTSSTCSTARARRRTTSTPNGQNWGFPTYNWEEMAKDNYEWWRRRLTTLSQCASLLSPLRCLPEGLKSGYKWYLSSPRVKIQRYLGCQSCFL